MPQQKDPAGVRCHRFEAALSFAAVPMYDYRCERCFTQFEVRQSFSEDTLTLCPVEGSSAGCLAPGEGPVKKVFSGVAISFKGDGFYKNDHGANAQGRREERESDSSKDSSTKEPSSSKDPSTKDSSSSKDPSTKDSSSSKDSSTKDSSSSKDSSAKDSSSSGASSDAGRTKAGARTSTPTS